MEQTLSVAAAVINMAIGAAGMLFASGYWLLVAVFFGGGVQHIIYVTILLLVAVCYTISGMLLCFAQRRVQTAALVCHLVAIVLGSVYCGVLLDEGTRREMVYRTHVGSPHPDAVYTVFHLPVVVVLFASCEWLWLFLKYRGR